MKPWSDNDASRPLWDVLPPKIGIAVREDYEERAAMMEYGANINRGRAELFAYAFTVERAWNAGLIDEDARKRTNVDSQLLAAKLIRRDTEKAYALGLRP